MLTDPNFFRTVVLLFENSEGGSMGVVINRPSEMPVEEPLPGWDRCASEPSVVFLGGPVAPESVIGLARLNVDSELPEAEWWLPLSSQKFALGMGTLDLSATPLDAEPYILDSRIFAGHAGWGGGQLEDEIASGAWFVVDLQPDDIFDSNPNDLWSHTLKRQGGNLAMLANFPVDPSTN